MNQNSFADNTARLCENVNIAIETLNAVTNSIIGDDASVVVNLPNDTSVMILSTSNILNRLENVENTVKSFTSGSGVVKLVDGTNRQIKVTTIPVTPKRIENVDQVSTFSTNVNWFFEDLMFPRLITKIDLKNNIDDDSDRIKVNRIIIDISGTNADNIINYYNEYIKDKNLSYSELIKLLSNYNEISYYEDVDTISFPLYEDDYIGSFNIVDRKIIDGNIYYYTDSIYYSYNNLYDQNTVNNIKLKIGDRVRYQQSIYVIESIFENENRLQLRRETGFDSIAIGDNIDFYNEPFKNKIIEIPIGMNEINCIYFKGINEDYNIIGNEWSDPVTFITNDLKLDNYDIDLKTYYMQYVSDFGAEWIAQAKERRISAYNGLIPNKVNLVADNFNVTKINTQINSTIDNDEVNNLRAKIDTLKSNISSLRETISNKRTDILNYTNSGDINNAQRDINNKIVELNGYIAQYTSTVNYLNSYLYEKHAIASSPKYRIRGFFNIPESRYLDEKNKLGKQEIIGFDIRYRYLKLDETGVPLTTHEYTDNDGNRISAVFSDWNLITSVYREREYNEETGLYQWIVENDADGNQININQIDIPISSGEKVEFMVRSISEAGYPNNPLKSDWSNSIIMEFPNNLSAEDELSNTLEDVKSEMTAISLDNTLRSAGYYSHIADEIVSESDNILYHHDSKNILYKHIDVSSGVKNVNLYDHILSLTNTINDLKKRIDTLEEKTN